MTCFNCFLLLLIVFVGDTHFTPIEEAIKEIHTFRWATSGNLNNSICATAWRPLVYQGYLIELLLHDSSARFIYLSAFESKESKQATCRSNRSLFVLVGNPGVIWHPDSGQCLHTTLDTRAVSGSGTSYGSDVNITYKTLRTSYECEDGNPNLALFKYDKNKPQRLFYLGDIDSKTGKREEWCIRSYYASVIQVAPSCNTDTDSPNWVHESFFHEVREIYNCTLAECRVI